MISARVCAALRPAMKVPAARALGRFFKPGVGYGIFRVTGAFSEVHEIAAPAGRVDLAAPASGHLENALAPWHSLSSAIAIPERRFLRARYASRRDGQERRHWHKSTCRLIQELGEGHSVIPGGVAGRIFGRGAHRHELATISDLRAGCAGIFAGRVRPFFK